MNTQSRPVIAKASKFVLLLLAALTVVAPFTNCDGYQTQMDSTGASTVSCSNSTCIMADASILNVTPHLPNGDYGVPANMAEFNIGGDCNEGGFPTNYIHWDLVDNTGAVVRHSHMELAPGYNAESKCINGRFMIYVMLSAMTNPNDGTAYDPYNRTGLLTPSNVRAAYNLHITIFVQDPSTGAQGQYQTNVPLSAI